MTDPACQSCGDDKPTSPYSPSNGRGLVWMLCDECRERAVSSMAVLEQRVKEANAR